MEKENSKIPERHFQLELLDVNKFISLNNWKEITNPIFFVRSGVPTSDGLLSNDIFGVSMDERSNIYGWIDLCGTFMHPLVYKKWSMKDRRIRDIAHGIKKFRLDDKGELIEDENGETGIEFIKKNIDKIKIKNTESDKGQDFNKFIKDNAKTIFINKMIIIPAYYRDANSTDKGIGVGEINKLYNSLLISVRSLKETKNYGFMISQSVEGRIQESILNIYNWFASEPRLSKKKGILRRAVESKTSDYAARLIITAPECKVETSDSLMVDLEHTAVPLAALCANLFPFMVYWIRRWFENHFAGGAKYPVINKKGKLEYHHVVDPLEQFSDERIKHELDRFMKGFSNRFIPITVKTEEAPNGVYMYFTGNNIVDPENQIDKNKTGLTPLSQRRLTWCDLIYMAAVENAKNKYVLITRYPIDSYYGQFPTKIRVGSTKETEPMYVNNTHYKFYPKIREEDILENTSNKFIDSLQMSNLHLKSIGGDYDGDQVTAKVAYSEESNKELQEYMKSNAYHIGLDGQNIRQCSNEAILSLYCMTMHLPENKLTPTKNIKIVKVK